MSDERQDVVDREAVGIALMVANDDDSAVRDKLATFIREPDRVTEMLLGSMTISGVLMQIVARLLEISNDEVAGMLLEVM
jgi:hypothetical protein